jgi:hypothetical protein
MKSENDMARLFERILEKSKRRQEIYAKAGASLYHLGSAVSDGMFMAEVARLKAIEEEKRLKANDTEA